MKKGIKVSTKMLSSTNLFNSDKKFPDLISILVIYEEFCDTEDWRNDAEKLPSQEYIFYFFQ